MSIPLIPENAPFTAPQRAWLNGFFAGMDSLGQASGLPLPFTAGDAAPQEEDYPWHDSACRLTTA